MTTENPANPQATDGPTDLNQLASDLGHGADRTVAPASSTTIPDKLKGKSAEEIAEMYMNLEKVQGRTANELGQQRQYTQTLMDQMGAVPPAHSPAAPAAASTPEPVKVDPVALLEDPTAELDKYFASQKQDDSEAVQRLAELEKQIAQQNFMTKHADFNEVGASQEFQDWTRQTPYRQALVQQTQGGDYNAADQLLTEYKAWQSHAPAVQPPAPATVADNALEAAQAASLESSATAASPGAAPSGKIFNSVDIQKLQMEQPEVYRSPAVQAELMKAYAEGRVK